jgi:transmembrane sensor
MTSATHASSAIRQDAADWLMRLQDADSAGEADWIEFDAWLSASPAHAAAYDDALAVWSDLGAMAPDLQAAARPIPLAARARPSRRLIGWGVAAAAAAAVLAVAVMPSVLTPTQTYETGRGQTRTVALSDGSTIHMNAGSKISVRMTGSERQVAMNDAQAVFDVAKDPARPFLITVADRTVRVVGTEFDVSHRGDALAVTVRRGIVEVRPDAASAAGAVRLVHGQRLDHAIGGDSRVSAVNPDEAFAWRAGRLIYRDRPLAEVVAELNRQFDRDIRLADATTGRQRVSGVLVLDDEKAVIERLSLLAPVSVSTADAGFVLRSNAPSN